MLTADSDRSFGPLILLYNSFFGSYPDLSRFNPPVPCRFTIDRSRLKEADAVVFHLPEHREMRDVVKYPGQIWVGYTYESRAHTLLLSNRRVMSFFDIIASHERSSDIWTPYSPPRSVWIDALARPVPPKTERRPAVLFQSASVDAADRNSFARELMGYLKVDSYGRFMNNIELKEPDLGRQTKLSVIGRYRFCLAFENSIEDDYVTEKFYDPLLAGTVPVYRGAPNVARYAPGERSYIDAEHFGGPRGLAAYLMHLANDEPAYAAHFAWRSRPPSPGFIQAADAMGGKSLFDRIAEAVSERVRQRPAGGTSRRRAARPFGWYGLIRTRLRRSARP